MKQHGMLFLVATPIGNMEDITVRAIKTLRKADLIAAEDTRRTAKLLNRYNIKTPMTSYHKHNRRQKSAFLIQKIKSGETVALVSDAGMPGISDPGQELVSKAAEEGLEVSVLPGASSVVAGLAVSGLPADSFVFEGFLPRKRKERIRRLKKLEYETSTVILFEAPHRLRTTLEEILDTIGDRRIALVRELTKVHEEIQRCLVHEAIKTYALKEPRGEYVIVVQGKDEHDGKEEERKSWDEINIVQHYEMYIEEGCSRMDAMKKTATDRGISKREVFDMLKKTNGKT